MNLNKILVKRNENDANWQMSLKEINDKFTLFNYRKTDEKEGQFSIGIEIILDRHMLLRSLWSFEM